MWKFSCVMHLIVMFYIFLGKIEEKKNVYSDLKRQRSVWRKWKEVNTIEIWLITFYIVTRTINDKWISLLGSKYLQPRKCRNYFFLTEVESIAIVLNDSWENKNWARSANTINTHIYVCGSRWAFWISLENCSSIFKA